MVLIVKSIPVATLVVVVASNHSIVLNTVVTTGQLTVTDESFNGITI